ncbi:hypothetical protein J5X84_41210 [Streptosporangiaceae bacterium NEAU-GS5]|nr:hypothetical protein [Streptosporangiaceae bacterium NEAU-GS5]
MIDAGVCVDPGAGHCAQEHSYVSQDEVVDLVLGDAEDAYGGCGRSEMG